MRFTVLGAGGFIGSQLLAALRADGHECFAPDRGDTRVFAANLGHAVYCIGLTADFRSRPFDTIRAHIGVLAEILERARFDSLLYLSSTRVYARAIDGEEDTLIPVNPSDASDYYNLTKLTAEALCFVSGRDSVRVARLSNVYGLDFGSENFLARVIRDAIGTGRVVLETALESAKDYVALEDVVDLLPRIATEGDARLYNVASGCNLTNRELAQALARTTGCRAEATPGAPIFRFPAISIERVRREFGFHPRSLVEDLGPLVARYREETKA